MQLKTKYVDLSVRKNLKGPIFYQSHIQKGWAHSTPEIKYGEDDDLTISKGFQYKAHHFYFMKMFVGINIRLFHA